MAGKNSRSHLIFMAVTASIGGILFGYDTAVISGTTEMVRSQFALGDIQEGWYVGCAIIGSIFGVLASGVLSDGLGRKKSMFISAVLFSISSIGCAICPDFSSLVAYRITGGIGIGIVSVVSPIYISEVSPAKVRGTLVSLYQLAITAGFLLAYLTNWMIGSSADATAVSQEYGASLTYRMFSSESWRGMLGSETILAILFLVTILFIPESPKWLIVKGRSQEAAAAANSKGTESSGSWKDLFRPGILTAVIAGCAIAMLGQFMGVNAVLYYGPKIFSEAGFSDPMFPTVLVGAVNMLTSIIAVLIIDRAGRKKLIYWGVSGMIICLICIGTYFAWGGKLGLGNGFMLTFFLAYVFCCAISISAVVFVLLSEMYPNSIRGRAMSVAGVSLWTGTYLIGQLTPVLLGWSQAGTFFLFAAMCMPYMLIVWKIIPETAGKTLEDIERYWNKH